ncbi:MAG: PepSY-associated TM helix domain-containing protein [Myxococcota bacterium]
MPLFPRKDRRFGVLYDVHAWIGVLVGLVLYVMFFTGALAVAHGPLQAWQEPAHHAPAAGDPDRWLAELGALAPVAPERVFLTLPAPDEGHRAPTAFVIYPDGREARLVYVAGAWAPLATRVAELLFNLHFLWHDDIPLLYDLAGVSCIAFLLAVVTGVAIHLRDLVPQLQRFRPELPPRLAWADLHKITGVVGLPFQVFFAYTGAFMVFSGTTFSAVSGWMYDGNEDRARLVAYGPDAPAVVLSEGTPGAVSSARWLTSAEAALPGLQPTRIDVRHPGQPSARVVIEGHLPGEPGEFEVTVEGATARVLAAEGPGELAPAEVAERWVYGVHFAWFGGWGVRAAYAVLGFATCAMLLTGNGLWLARRRREADSVSNRLLARLTIGVAAGTPLAIAATLLASRLLPWGLLGRHYWEQGAFVAALAASCMWAGLASSERDVWWRQLGLAAALCALVPVAQAGVTDAGLLGERSDAHVVAVDIGLLVSAAVLAAIAWGLARRSGVSADAADRPAAARESA